MVKRYYLSSIGGCVLAITLSCFSLAISIVLIIYSSQVGILPIIISLICAMFSIFGTFLCFWNGIKIDFRKDVLIVKSFLMKTMKVSMLKSIFVSTENSLNAQKYGKIIFEDKNRNKIEINGFLSIFKYKDVEKTQKLVNRIIADINYYSKVKINRT